MGYFFPLKIFTLYVALSLGLSFYGPVVYQDYNKELVFYYILSFIILFSFGYFFGVVIKTSDSLDRSISISRQRKVLSILKFSLVSVSILKFVQVVYVLAGGANFNLASTGAAYFDFYSGYERNSGSYSLQFLSNIFFQVPILISMILGLFYFPKLNKFYSSLVLFVYLSIFFIHVLNEGKQKYLGDMIIFVASIGLIKLAALPKVERWRKLIKISSFVGLAVLILVIMLKSRYDAIDISAYNINDKVNPIMQYDLNHWVFDIFGFEWGYPLAVFLAYLSQGYYGLSLCLDLPFVWTGFLGHSYSIMIIYNRFFGGEFIIDQGYLMRMEAETGWDGLSKWHTVFPWLASDITFVGCLVLFLFVAYIYAQSWKESIRHNNPLSILLFTHLTLGLIFVPSNNQLLHAPESYLATVFFLTVWIFFHKRFNLS